MSACLPAGRRDEEHDEHLPAGRRDLFTKKIQIIYTICVS